MTARMEKELKVLGKKNHELVIGVLEMVTLGANSMILKEKERPLRFTVMNLKQEQPK
jgi:hypothetical protein